MAFRTRTSIPAVDTVEPRTFVPPSVVTIRGCAAAADATPPAVSMREKWCEGPKPSTRLGKLIGKTLLRILQAPLGRVGSEDRQDVPLELLAAASEVGSSSPASTSPNTVPGSG